MSNKPREFWIFKRKEYDCALTVADYPDYVPKDAIHVIEYSAYEESRRESQQLSDTELNKTAETYKKLFKEKRDDFEVLNSNYEALRKERDEALKLRRVIHDKASAHDDGNMAYYVVCQERDEYREALEKAIAEIGDGNNGPPQFYLVLFEQLEEVLAKYKGEK